MRIDQRLLTNELSGVHGSGFRALAFAEGLVVGEAEVGPSDCGVVVALGTGAREVAGVRLQDFLLLLVVARKLGGNAGVRNLHVGAVGFLSIKHLWLHVVRFLQNEMSTPLTWTSWAEFFLSSPNSLVWL